MDNQGHAHQGCPFLGAGSIPGLGAGLGRWGPGIKVWDHGKAPGLGVPGLPTASCFGPDRNFPSGPDFLQWSCRGGGSLLPLSSSPGLLMALTSRPGSLGKPFEGRPGGVSVAAPSLPTRTLPRSSTSAERDAHCL